MPGGLPLQLNAPNAGNRVLLDDQLVAVGRGGAHAGLGVELIPGAQPACYSVLIRLPVLDSYPVVYRPSQWPSFLFLIFPSPLARFFAILLASFATTQRENYPGIRRRVIKQFTFLLPKVLRRKSLILFHCGAIFEVVVGGGGEPNADDSEGSREDGFFFPAYKLLSEV